MARSYQATAEETRGQRIERVRAVAKRQASGVGKQHPFVPGEPIGVHKFVSFVGDNPTALYINFECGKCGAHHSYKRDQVSALRKTQGCKLCARGFRSVEKAQAAE